MYMLLQRTETSWLCTGTHRYTYDKNRIIRKSLNHMQSRTRGHLEGAKGEGVSGRVKLKKKVVSNIHKYERK